MGENKANSNKDTRVSREQLYEEVWAEPKKSQRRGRFDLELELAILQNPIRKDEAADLVTNYGQIMQQYIR